MKRNKFSLSHYKLCTFDMGLLIPITWYEVIPGDTIQQASSALVRVSPLLSPVMHPVVVRIHHWFVPFRLIWDDWEDFITGGADGNNASVVPYISTATVTEGDLADYLGVPPASYSPNLEYCAMPTRAYDLIFNEHYRDQDLVTALTIDKTDGQDSTSATAVQKVAWQKDYFTTARPWEQKGTAVSIPLLGESPIFGDNMDFDAADDSGNYAQVRDAQGGSANLRSLTTNGVSGGRLFGLTDSSGTGELKADLTQATGIRVNDLRLSLAIQRYQEARAQYGSRYVEYLRYLGIRSSDGRLQNPEYLGGGRQVIQFSEVLATDGANTGKLYGHGISAMRTNRYRRFFEEHGIVMSLMSVIPKSIYANGLHKSFSREAKEDYFQRELQNIGDQEVLNKEVYTEHTTPDGEFGYTSRYDEYRSLPSTIAGEFRSSLDHWHMARIFASDPSLNSTFVQAVPTKRVLASSGTDALYVMASHSIQARRMMSKFARSKTF